MTINLISFQNDNTLISYRDERYHLSAGVNCQKDACCFSYLPDRGKIPPRGGEKAPDAELFSPKGKRILMVPSCLGSGNNRTAR